VPKRHALLGHTNTIIIVECSAAGCAGAGRSRVTLWLGYATSNSTVVYTLSVSTKASLGRVQWCTGAFCEASSCRGNGPLGTVPTLVGVCTGRAGGKLAKKQGVTACHSRIVCQVVIDLPCPVAGVIGRVNTRPHLCD
jgi:hypothetical protein